MTEQIETLKQIVADAPEGATHFSPHPHCPFYLKEYDIGYYAHIDSDWIDEPILNGYANIQSISNIKTIIAQHERIVSIERLLSNKLKVTHRDILSANAYCLEKLAKEAYTDTKEGEAYQFLLYQEARKLREQAKSLGEVDI